MKKICAALFIFCYVVMSATVHAETVEVNGKTLNCESRAKDLYLCMDGFYKVLVTQSDEGFIAIRKASGGYPIIEVVNKISNRDRVLYMIYPEKATYSDNLANRKRAADIVATGLQDYTDEYAKELVALSKRYLNSAGNFNQVKITVNPNGTPINCTRGEGKDPKNQCDFFSCTSDDPEEKLLALIPTDIYSSFSPNILSMKKGETRLVDGDFKIANNKGETVDDIPPNQYSKNDYVSPVQNSWGLDNEIFIPKALERSKSSFNYVRNTRNMVNFLDYQNYCTDKKITELLDEKNKVAAEMDEELAKAEIVEYLRLVNGNIESLYVDRQKGLELGCFYQGRILGKDVASDLSYLHKIANPISAKKLLSEKEVQNLFKKAKSMKDIPFDYKRNGCFARAHVMARRFEAMGIPTQKVWIKGKLFVPGTDLRWDYHVAPVVEVKGKNGQIQKYVIDPSLTDKAVTLDEWVAKMGKKGKGPVVYSRYPVPENVAHFQRTTVVISSSNEFAAFDLRNLTEKEKMSEATEVLKKYSEAVAKGITNADDE